MPDWQPLANREKLLQRAETLSAIRSFFAQRDVLEVETPALSMAANTDPMLESIPARLCERDFFLHTSPEFAMKRLLAGGSGDIYQICKVYRAGESGRYHNPEFTLLEWYRVGMDYLDLANEVVNLVIELEKNPDEITVKTISYRELFTSFINVDPVDSEISFLKEVAAAHVPDCPQLEFDGYLDLLLSHCICPQLPEEQLTIVYDYPASQAALARINADGITAARFEIFRGGLELANGFQELQDAEEQGQRFEIDNFLRRGLGKPEMPVDENLLAALSAGLPDCSGVAMGIDRLLMCTTGAGHINEVLTFNISNS